MAITGKTILLSLFAGMLLSCSIKAQTSYRDTLITWAHFEYTLDENNGMATYSTNNIVESQYPGLVIENKYIRLVVMPDFGARIISYYYRPSQHEQLYINPVGTPYGIGEGNFYYNWLMVMGGIFPTFPEPEHGKTWFLPWEWELTEVTGESVTLKMEFKDSINYPGHPGKFNNGITGVICTSSLVLEKSKASFGLTHSIRNTKAESVAFEYWTCTTLAPGSEPGNTFTPANSEIIAPIEHVYLKDDWWSWMGLAETPAYGLGSHVFEYKNLAHYENWVDMGIAYAYPNIEANYYGVINHENEEGIFRVADNSATTKGMKFWTWGAEQGLNADPTNYYHVARPYIELWSGLSTQFFEDAILSPGEIISFQETYLPTIGMPAVSMVNENGAIHLNHLGDPDEHFKIRFFAAEPDKVYHLDIALEGQSPVNLFNDDLIAQSDACKELSLEINDYIIEEGDYILTATLSEPGGQTLLSGSRPVTIPLPPDGIIAQAIHQPGICRIGALQYKIDFRSTAERRLLLFSANGQLVSETRSNHDHAIIKADRAGIYILQIIEYGYSHAWKISF
ncbi:MAG: DUF5107 domain-containing protein [Bacteroidales bacterium]|nr:DUF5107 domain-containing protein [Bacteroidales bacterium]